jgi:hypothetical protein
MGQAGSNQLFIMAETDGVERDITPLVRKFVWVDSLLDGGFSWKLSASTHGRAEWQALLLGLESAFFRIEASHSLYAPSTEWTYGVVDSSSIAYQSAGAAFSVTGADRRLEMQQRARTRAWLGATTSEIVQAIGAEYGFLVVADTTNDVDDRWQLRTTDWEFLLFLVKSVSLPHGRGDVYLHVVGGTLLFGAVAAHLPPVRVILLDDSDGRTHKAVVAYNGREVDRAGGCTLRGVGYDFQAKTGVVYTLDNAAAATYSALAGSVPRPQVLGTRVVPVPQTRVDLVHNEVHGRWGKIAQRYLSIRIDIMGDLALRPGVTFDVVSGVGEYMESPLLGRYVLYEVRHVLSLGQETTGGGVVTTLVGFRRESGIGLEVATGSPVAVSGTVSDFGVNSNAKISVTNLDA